MEKISSEKISTFLNGRDPMEHIISIECDYNDDNVCIVYVAPDGVKRIRREAFNPFVWVRSDAISKMCDGKKGELRKLMLNFGISAKKLKTGDSEIGRLERGYNLMFFAKKPMSFQRFQQFFNKVKVPIYPKFDKDGDIKKRPEKYILSVSPVEQYMITSGRRLFKGYENYNDLKRFSFDLETEGLNPEIHCIEQIGIRTNKGLEKVLSVTGEGEEKFENEMKAICDFFSILAKEKPDVVFGHNSENFDFDFIEVRCRKHGVTMEDVSLGYFKRPIYKKKRESVLKLGGEVEYYHPTVIWGHSVVDSLHAVRRAQALDSDMESASLKYVTKYLGLKKRNRVYVSGDQISTIWNDLSESYAFNDEDGDWYKVSEEKPLRDGYTPKSGRYIVERYLLDDLWETDNVELKLNESNFLVGKMLPTTFQKACTMGTASIWKLIMLAWCYENNLAIPAFDKPRRFTGGLSRLLKTGYVPRIVKLDYNSLYPSIILTWFIITMLDISGVMQGLLEYILTQREKYKELKGDAGARAKEFKTKLTAFVGNSDERAELEDLIQYWESVKSANDKLQLPLKILANSFFGSFGAPHLFPFGDTMAAEKTTCIGRMSLRLMISHFTRLGYTPIVGDTDGFNFQIPNELRYTDEHPYISNGKGRNSVEGKAYTGVDADVAEFEDLYFNAPWNGGINKMGLGVDEYCDATINFSRKNYADLLPDGKIKKVGNTIKSRKMSGYLKRFLDEGISLLLHGDGQQFLENYYNYIDDIYNYRIPIKEIASKGKIKKSLEDYKKDCNTLTKSGQKKSRQAWYELAIRNGLKPNISDTIYYINTGTQTSHGDVKRIKTQYMKDPEGNVVEAKGKVKTDKIKELCLEQNLDYKSLTAKQKTELISPYIINETEEIILNCKLVPQEIVDSERDILCSEVEGMEYNVAKYIKQFNARIKTLLVCFSPEIRNDILITNPDDRKSFTKKQSELVSGFPNNEGDQDTYEALMTPERKEIEFWLKDGERPPFIEECGIDWEELVKNHLKTLEEEESVLFQEENKKYLDALESITEDDVDALEQEGVVPKVFADIVTLDENMYFHFIKLPNMTPSTGGYLFEDVCHLDTSEEKYEIGVEAVQ